MKGRYVICLTQRLDDIVRMQIRPEEIVTEKTTLGLLEMAKMSMGGGGKDMEKIQKKMQREAILMQNPDIITISYDEWKKHDYKLDDVVIVTLESEK